MDAVLFESAVMMIAKPEFEALTLLRGIFDVVDADVRPTEDLLARLTGHAPARLNALVAQLRGAGLLQRPEGAPHARADLGLTMAGLVIAARLPPFQPEPARARSSAPTQAVQTVQPLQASRHAA